MAADSPVDEEGKKNTTALGQRAELCMPDEAVMSERIEFSSSRSGVECLFVEQGGKKMGGGRPPKNIVQELFCQNGVRVEGTGKGREKVTEWAVSGLGWCG